MSDLLLEIGAEELPPAAIAPALEQLQAGVRAGLEAARLEVGTVSVTGTVRRLVLAAGGISGRQRDLVTEVRGPAARVAYDAEGRPTRAAEGFARSQGGTVADLRVVDRDGGRYVVVEKREAGRPAADVLRELLPAVVAGLAFPRTMRWEASGFRFARPIRWIVALLDGRVIPLVIAGVKAGRRSHGQRFLSPRPVVVSSPGSYRRVIARAHVVLEPADRRARITESAARLAAEIGGTPLLDSDLLHELVWSIEHPTPVRGNIDAGFMTDLPRPVLVTTLQHHQKYFAVEDAQGRLLPAFIAVRDGGAAHMDTVRTGHEWVVRARLADARFFLDEDRRGTFDRWNTHLERLAHAAGLGSMADHVGRLRRTARWLAEAARLNPAETAPLERAAALCKADLVTAMVGEFPELQGTMGGIYARWAGEPEPVAAAIEQQYLPRGAGDPAPSSLIGGLLGVADRATLLAGCVQAGLAPSGSQDPYGLRRAASGIVVILLAHSVPISIGALFETATSTFVNTREAGRPTVEACTDLIRQRLRTLLIDQGIAYDTVDAVLAVSSDDVPDAAARARALHAVRGQPAMARLATGFARASRILSQGSPAAEISEDALKEPMELGLYEAWRQVRATVSEAADARRYADALRVLERLADPIDAFFEQVLVMAPDAAVRANRLALLQAITHTFLKVANLGLLTGERPVRTDTES